MDAAATHPSVVWSSAAATLLAARPQVVPPPATDLLHTEMDSYFLMATYNPAKWDPYFDPIAHLPASLLGDLLAAGIDPRDRSRRGLYNQ